MTRVSHVLRTKQEVVMQNAVLPSYSTLTNVLAMACSTSTIEWSPSLLGHRVCIAVTAAFRFLRLLLGGSPVHWWQCALSLLPTYVRVATLEAFHLYCTLMTQHPMLRYAAEEEEEEKEEQWKE